MKYKIFMGLLAASFIYAAPAAGYDGLTADYKTCTTGQGKVANGLVVAACTRLIDNAAKENSLVGMFHALRASANNDKNLNCRDAVKARELVTDPNLAGAIDDLENANC